MIPNISPNKLSTDVTVPRTQLPAVLSEVMKLGAKYGLTVGNVFHAGDGNLHPQVLYDSRDAEQECTAFHKRTGRIIKLLTVQEILDEEFVQKM